ncbi:hypothetical protein D3C80_1599860 [compost metagenome]
MHVDFQFLEFGEIAHIGGAVFEFVGFLGAAADADKSAELGLVLAQAFALFPQASPYADCYE